MEEASYSKFVRTKQNIDNDNLVNSKANDKEGN